MLCKFYNFYSKKVEINEIFNAIKDPIMMPCLQLEDKNEKEIFLYDVLSDEEGNGWVIYFHEMGYLCLYKIGSTPEDTPLPIMDVIKTFGKHYYKVPMEVVGNKYVDHIEDSTATPERCKRKFKEYLEKYRGNNG